MLAAILRNTVLLQYILLSGAERPKYRLDYWYEKAFDNFYKLHTAATSWSEARIRCQAEGSELMVPDSLDEADTIPLLVTGILTKFDGIFVGIHDLYSERTFVTIKGASMMDSILNLLWEYKHPVHRAGRCVAMRRTGRFFVHPCENPLPFICKISGKSIEFRDECNSFNENWKLGPNGTCYFMHVEPQTWSQAYASCLSAGGHLAILNNQAEADHIRTLYKQHTPKRMPVDDFAFLGFNDIFQRHHYRTVHAERLADLYNDWEVSCPESTNSSSTSTQRCGGIRRSGLLDVRECNEPAMFFCEKPANGSSVKNMLRHSRHEHGPKHRENHELTLF